MFTKTLCFLLCSHLLPTSATSDFMINVSPVPFESSNNNANRLDGDYVNLFLEVNNIETSTTNATSNECPSTIPPEGPFGTFGTITNSDEQKKWRIRFTGAKHLKINYHNETPTTLLLNIHFDYMDGTSACDNENAFDGFSVVVKPSTGFTLVNDYINVDACKLIIRITLRATLSDCNPLGDIEFGISGAKELHPGSFHFNPCSSVLKIKGPKYIGYNDIEEDTNPVGDDEPRGRLRFLQNENGCPYCPPDNPECPCCHTTLTTQPEGPSSSQKPSAVAIAGVTLAAVATVLALMALVIALRNRKGDTTNGNAVE